jgi:hypothetical protein
MGTKIDIRIPSIMIYVLLVVLLALILLYSAGTG